MTGLIQLLLKKKFLDKERATALEFELRETGRRPEEVILERRLVSEAVLFRLKSEMLRIPLKEVFPDDVPAEILELIPEESASHYQMVALSHKDKAYEVGMVYPEDITAQEALQFLSRQHKFDYHIVLIAPSTLKGLLRKYRSLRGEVSKALSELERELAAEKVSQQLESGREPKELERVMQEAPITKVVAVILRHAQEGAASDIHVEPSRDKTRIRFRVDGILHSSLFLPGRIHPAVMARIKILANLKIDEMRLPQDGRFTAKINEQDIDFRVSTFPTILGEKAALRILDPTMGNKTFEELGLSGRNLEVVKKVVVRPFGMLLATGPTGSGKTTTLYAVLNTLNREGVNIMTIEDPVEYYIEGINQSFVKPEIGYDFARALRHMVRQDPDIIMVGEIRDEETAALATHAALTGHVLLSTLHTNNAVGAIPRLIDMGIKPFLIPPTLAAVIAQRLVRRLCQSCRQQIAASDDIETIVQKELSILEPKIRRTLKIPQRTMIWQAPGCKKCNFKGFIGRIGIFEILELTDQLSAIIRQEPSEIEIEKEARRQGMISMRQDGILKALQGLTTVEEVMQATAE